MATKLIVLLGCISASVNGYYLHRRQTPDPSAFISQMSGLGGQVGNQMGGFYPTGFPNPLTGGNSEAAAAETPSKRQTPDPSAFIDQMSGFGSQVGNQMGGFYPTGFPNPLTGGNSEAAAAETPSKRQTPDPSAFISQMSGLGGQVGNQMGGFYPTGFPNPLTGGNSEAAAAETPAKRQTPDPSAFIDTMSGFGSQVGNQMGGFYPTGFPNPLAGGNSEAAAAETPAKRQTPDPSAFIDQMSGFGSQVGNQMGGFYPTGFPNPLAGGNSEAAAAETPSKRQTPDPSAFIDQMSGFGSQVGNQMGGFYPTGFPNPLTGGNSEAAAAETPSKRQTPDPSAFINQMSGLGGQVGSQMGGFYPTGLPNPLAGGNSEAAAGESS